MAVPLLCKCVQFHCHLGMFIGLNTWKHFKASMWISSWFASVVYDDLKLKILCRQREWITHDVNHYAWTNKWRISAIHLSWVLSGHFIALCASHILIYLQLCKLVIENFFQNLINRQVPQFNSLSQGWVITVFSPSHQMSSLRFGICWNTFLRIKSFTTSYRLGFSLCLIFSMLE